MRGMKTSTPNPQWRRAALALLVTSFLGLTACVPGNSVAQTSAGVASPSPMESMMQIRLTVGEQVTTATLYDNATARDFASLLPLSLTMTDYATIERVSNLPRKLSTQGTLEGMAPVVGELAYYAPLGNLVTFTEPPAFSHSLLLLGKVEEDLSILSQPGPYQVHIERIEP